MKLGREVIWANVCWFSYHKRYLKVWRRDGCNSGIPSPVEMWGERGTQTSRARLIVCPCLWGLEGHHRTYKRDLRLARRPLGGIPGLPTYIHTPWARHALCLCLHLSLEGANPSGHLPAETMKKAKLCPAKTTPTTIIVPLPVLVYPSCFLPHFPGLPVQEGLALGRKSQYPPILMPRLVRIQGIPQSHKVLPTGIPCPNAGSNRSRVFFSPQLAFLGAWNFIKSFLPPTLDPPGTKFFWEWGSPWLLS